MKNLGWNLAKPDRHLRRLGRTYGLEVDELCEAISKVTSDRTATVDLVLWRLSERRLIGAAIQRALEYGQPA